MGNPTITIVGRLLADPEVKDFGSNTVTRFRLITSDRKKTESGTWEDINTSGWNVLAWNGLSDSCKNILEKGQEVIVSGNMRENAWTDKEGNSRRTVELHASNIGVSTYSIQKAAKTTSSTSQVEDTSSSMQAWEDTF
jgi:single-strand DNA-binding protein